MPLGPVSRSVSSLAQRTFGGSGGDPWRPAEWTAESVDVIYVWVPFGRAFYFGGRSRTVDPFADSREITVLSDPRHCHLFSGLFTFLPGNEIACTPLTVTFFNFFNIWMSPNEKTNHAHTTKGKTICLPVKAYLHM